MRAKTAGYFVVALALIGIIVHREWPNLALSPPQQPDEPLPAALPTQQVVEKLPAATPRHPAQTALVSHFNSGNYGKALELAQQYRTEYANDPEFMRWLEAQQPVLLTSQGWYLLKTGHCEEATGLFTQAVAKADVSEAWKGLGVCYRKNNSILEAERALEQALKTHPEDLESNWLYVDVLESEQRFEDAIARMEMLRQRNLIPTPQQERWEKRFASMQAKAQESPLQGSISSIHTAIRFRAGDFDQIAQLAMETIEDALATWQNEYRWDLTKFHVEVLLYPSNQFPTLVNESPQWAMGIFDGRIRIPVLRDFINTENNETLRRIIRHETLHAVLTTLADQRPLPPWFQEGVAQYMECPQTCARFQFPPAPGNFVDAPLFTQTFQKHARAKARMMYLQSWYMVLVIQNKLNQQHLNPLQTIFASLNAISPVDSDGLLKPLNISFASLHQYSRELWEKQISF